MRKGTCIHFHGIQHKTCAAGLELASVRDSSQPGPYRWPCLTLAGREPATTKCSLYLDPTDEQIAAWDQQVAAAFTALDQGLSPCCKAPLDESQVDKNGTGNRYCSACKQWVMRGCNRIGENLGDGDKS